MLSPIVKDELENETSVHTVSETILALEKNYKVQVNPRAINLFYLSENSRERILFENGIYKINNTNITFSKDRTKDWTAHGSAVECAKTLAEYNNCGVKHVALRIASRDQNGQFERLINDVLPLLN